MASVKLEVGKFYRTRDGQKVGPIRWADAGNHWATAPGCDHDQWYTQNFSAGESGRVSILRLDGMDIISEWTDAPTTTVRTVTRKELVPGLYGNVYVEKYEGQLGASMEFTAEPAVIRAAIAKLTEIADALEDNQ